MEQVEKNVNNVENVPVIELRHVDKHFGELHVLKDINLSVKKGEVVVVIGPSGSGKSTLCRTINRLETIDSGEILIDGTKMPEEGRKLAGLRSQIGMVFQSFNLFAHKTILDNVTIAPMDVLHKPKKEAREEAMELLKRVGVDNQAAKVPAQLSGGQQQRIAIARALATDPKVLLCDEATSALDPKTTHAILELIRDINRRLGITVIIITHQMSVVEEICSRVAILDSGSVVEEGVVSEVFSSPKSGAAKRLVFPDGADEILEEVPGERRIRVVFSGAVASREPLIAKMAMEEQITASILGASTKSIGDKAYGNMLLGLPDDDGVVKRAIQYLSSIPDVLVEEVTGDVR